MTNTQETENEHKYKSTRENKPKKTHMQKCGLLAPESSELTKILVWQFFPYIFYTIKSTEPQIFTTETLPLFFLFIVSFSEFERHSNVKMSGNIYTPRFVYYFY